MLTDLEAELLKRTQKEEPKASSVTEVIEPSVNPVFEEPEDFEEEEQASQEELYLKAAMYVKMFAPSFNILVDFIYSRLILPKGLSISELLRIQQAGKQKRVTSQQEAEYYKSIDTMLFGYSNAKILEEEYEIFIESFIPVADYFSKKSKSPFGGLAFVLGSKLVPIVMQGYMNRDKIKKPPVHQTEIVPEPTVANYVNYEEA
jgi:hypothetical protein